MRSSSVSWSSSMNGSSHWKFTGAGLSFGCARTLMTIPFAPQRWCRRLVLCSSAFKVLVGDDLDAEAGEALVVVHRRGEMADRGDAKIAQDLRADADLAPLLVAVGLRRFRLVERRHRHARGAVAQVNQHAAAGFLEMFQHDLQPFRPGKDVLDDVGLVKSRQHVPPVPDAVIDEGGVMD